MTTTLQRSNVEFAKRIFLDRLTVDAQPLSQPSSIDTGPGAQYWYAGYYDAYDFGVGADCSGASGIFIGAAINGPLHMAWSRLFDTQSFPTPFDANFRATNQQDLLTGPYPIKVAIHRAGGGANDHMNVWIDGWLMESSGDYGTCTLNYGAIPQSDSYWTDFYVLDGSIVEDTLYRQPMGYPRVLDYAGGIIPGTVLAAAGVTAVCRYLTPGGTTLPNKQLTPRELLDLTGNGIAVVFNYETTATFMLSDDGAAAAQTALTYVQSMYGAPANPVIYFSCDFDEAESQQATINTFCQRAQTVLPGRVGLYGPYYCLQRAADAGVVNYLWQTEAWSGFAAGQQAHVDSRVNLVQRNNIGYQTVNGVQCDINEAHTTDFGQWLPQGTQPVTPVPSPVQPPFTYPSDHDMLTQVWEQLFGPQSAGWPALFGNTPDGSRGKYTVEAISDLHQTLLKGPQA